MPPSITAMMKSRLFKESVMDRRTVLYVVLSNVIGRQRADIEFSCNSCNARKVLGACRTIHEPAANPAVWSIFRLLFDSQEVLTEMAGLRHQKEVPLSQLGPKKINAFCVALKQRLQDKESNFGKEYLRLLVDEINVDGDVVQLRGSYGALAGVLNTTKVELREGVPTFGSGWLPELGSNYSSK